jgi:hypothetical protein
MVARQGAANQADVRLATWTLRSRVTASTIGSSISTTAMEIKKPLMPRRVGRMTTDAPSGKPVDFDPTEATGSHADAPLKVLDPAPVVDWRGSSFDLLNGVEVRDHSDTIPGALFDRLFKR